MDEAGALLTGTSASQVQGTVAHDSASAQNPVQVGGNARQTNPTAVTDGDVARIITDDVGRTVNVPHQVRDLIVQQTTTITASTTETTVLTAGAAGVFHDLIAIWFANTGSANIRVDLRDATAGSVISSFAVPARNTVGVVFSAAFKQASSANNWTAQCSASTSSLYVTAQAAKNV